MNQVHIEVNPRYGVHPTEAPFRRQDAAHKPTPFHPKTKKPVLSPPPRHNPWLKKQKVFVYQGSNGKKNPGKVEEELSVLSSKYHVKKQYDIEYLDTYTLPRTLREMEQRDHSNAVVLVHIGTNDIRFRKNQPKNWLSQQSPQVLVKKMISLLKTQTHPENIVFMECPPSLAFDMLPYNRANYNLCKRE